MTGQLHVRVPAKVNLSLKVGPARADGYHELATVFQALSLVDDVQAELAPAGELHLAFRGEGAAFLPTDDTNLAIRAARAMMERFDRHDAGLDLVIRKNIPVAGGMAGGSADAAAVLVACNELWDCGASSDDLAGVAATLGADVPFALMGGTALGTSRGDRLKAVEARGEYHWTLALAHTGLSTPAVFSRFDEIVSAPADPEVGEDLLAALASGDVRAVGDALTNDLQDPCLDMQPELAATLEAGRGAGALGSVVSGSGPTCAFLSASEQEAQRVADALASVRSVHAVRTAHGPVQGAAVVR